MKFLVPNGNTEFEIPDDWWQFADMSSFKPGPGGYFPYAPNPSGEVRVVALSTVEPPLRASSVPPFKKYKLVPILLAFTSPECAVPPVEVEPSSGAYSFRVRNGYHRFYASVAVGYYKLPVRVLPPFAF